MELLMPSGQGTQTIVDGIAGFPRRGTILVGPWGSCHCLSEAGRSRYLRSVEAIGKRHIADIAMIGLKG
jgi:hypothetical protein